MSIFFVVKSCKKSSYISIFITIGIYGWFTFKVTEWRVKLRRKMNEQDTDASQKAVDSLLNFETVKYFNAEEREANRYDISMAGYEDAALKTAYSLGFLNFGQSVLITLGLVIVMVMAAIGVQNSILTVGDFVMVNAYMIQITMPLNFLGTIYREIRQALVDMGEMFNLLDQKREVVDKPNAQSIKVEKGHVKVSNVYFSYDNNRQILEDLKIEIQGGTKVAIVGSSGSGKSTIGRLLFRFYDVSGGSVSIDGQDIKDVTQSSLHNVIGVVPQDTVLFNDSVFYNIAYANLYASTTEIKDAAKYSFGSEFIEKLPNKFETLIGENGIRLSGGEKQRISIARAMLKKSSIILLDEATSSLDSDTETKIQEAIKLLTNNKTTLVIAHRLSTIQHVDCIYVMDKGQIVESGTHDELVRADGFYSKLYRMQFEH